MSSSHCIVPSFIQPNDILKQAQKARRNLLYSYDFRIAEDAFMVDTDERAFSIILHIKADRVIEVFIWVAYL
jgi:hypothetical protein